MPIWAAIFSQKGTQEDLGFLRAHNLADYLKSIQQK
jgi:hypothetical protein